MTIRASNLYFLRAKERWETTTPIRGRSEDIRPLGDRRHCHKRVVKIDEDTYAYRYYATNVVTYHSDGRIVIDSNGWISLTTCEFLNAYSPFIVSRADNKYWVRPYSHNKSYPVSASTPLTLRELDTGWVADERVIKRKVLNKERMRDFRKDIKGFTDMVGETLKITDGWIQSTTMAEYSKSGPQQNTYGRFRYHEFSFEKPITEPVLRLGWSVNGDAYKESVANAFEVMTSGSDTERVKLMLAVLQYLDKDGMDANDRGFKFRVTIQSFRNWVSQFLRLLDVYDIVTVEDGCFARGLIV